MKINFYDFCLTLNDIEDYNISRVLLEHKNKNIVFMSGNITEPEYNTKYILDYYMLDEYQNSSIVLNGFKEEVERIEI